MSAAHFLKDVIKKEFNHNLSQSQQQTFIMNKLNSDLAASINLIDLPFNQVYCRSGSLHQVESVKLLKCS